jgi:hypothetical protein
VSYGERVSAHIKIDLGKTTWSALLFPISAAVFEAWVAPLLPQFSE